MKPHYNVVAAVITYKGKILSMQRLKDKYEYTSYHWEFPGGKIELKKQREQYPNVFERCIVASEEDDSQLWETPQEALHRELLEKMDYDVEVGDYICTMEYEYPDFIITKKAYWCTASSRNFSCKEYADFEWMLPEELHRLDWCAADVPVMMEIRKHFGISVVEHFYILGEGGSKRVVENNGKFAVVTNEAALSDFLEEKDLESVSLCDEYVFDSLEEAIGSIGNGIICYTLEMSRRFSHAYFSHKARAIAESIIREHYQKNAYLLNDD